MAELNNGLLRARIMHRRLLPRQNQFVYHVYYLCFPLSQLAKLASGWLRLERFGVFSFYKRDYGARDGSELLPWIRGLLARYGVTAADGEVVLMTMPRVLGHVFNPVSFWFCLDKTGGLRAVLAEVNNTFGERHCYLLFHDDQRVIAPDEWLKSNKMFYVSPFLEVKGSYLFRFHYQEHHVGVWIDYQTDEGLVLQTFVGGVRAPLTNASLMCAFCQIPLVTLKVIALIHYQAVKLWLKRVPYVRRPKPPGELISR